MSFHFTNLPPEIPPPADETPANAPAEASPFAKILHLVWLSIALGMFLEVVALLVALFGTGLPSFAAGMAETMQKVSWSLFVCVALGIGSTTVKAMREAAGGVLGLLAAPLAFLLAKTLHRAVGAALGAAAPPEAISAPNPWILAILKGIEFCVLGAIAAWLTKQSWADVKYYALLGLAVAVVFGTLIVGYTLWSSDPVPVLSKAIALGLNEFLYPIGCALAIFGSDALGQRLSSTEQPGK